MHVDHLPDGSFKRILENRKYFPKPNLHELKKLNRKFNLNWGTRPELANLRTMPKHKDLCDFADKVCNFLGIPPINLYYYPDSIIIDGFITCTSNTVILTGDINKVQSYILQALIGHEMGHGLQGDLDEFLDMGNGIGEDYARLSEFRADMFSFAVSSFQSIHDMLYLFEEQTRQVSDTDMSDEEEKQLFFGANGDYPGIMTRRLSIIGAENNRSWQNFVRPNGQFIPLRDPKVSRIDALTEKDRSQVHLLVGSIAFCAYENFNQSLFNRT